jgi:hypothetical protein
MDNNYISAACCLSHSALLAKGVLEIRSGKLPFGSINEPAFAPFLLLKKGAKANLPIVEERKSSSSNALLYNV